MTLRVHFLDQAVSTMQFGPSAFRADSGDETMTRPFADLKVIDVDAHITEPDDLWTTRAPAGYEDRVPASSTSTASADVVDRRRACSAAPVVAA